MRFLPTTLVVMVAGPVAGRLTDRIGPRWLMTGGLVFVAASLAWQSRIDVDTSYGYLLPAFMVMGAGIGLVMSPMSTAVMNAVDRARPASPPARCRCSAWSAARSASRHSAR